MTAIVKYRKRRSNLKRGRKMRMPKRRINNTVHSFVRTVHVDSQFSIPTSASAVGKGVSFNLNSLPSVSEFTALFDQYRVSGIKYSIVPKQGIAVLNTIPSVPGAFAPVMPKIYSVVDYDDS